MEPPVLQLFINGAFIDGKSTFPVIDAATEEVLAHAPAASPEQVDDAVKAAAAAFETWGQTMGKERAKYLRSMAAEIGKRSARLGELEARDSGKPLPVATGEIGFLCGCLAFYADLAEELDARDKDTPRVDIGDEGIYAMVKLEPIGVVGAITPWNFPAITAAAKWAPALAAGCTIVLKPSELAPLTALELGLVAQAVGLPPGVFNVVTGFGDPVGKTLATHPLVDKLTFTGSVPTGRVIARNAAEQVVPVTLELGGKSPAIVFDTDDKTLEWIMYGIFANAGQVCSATSRLLLDEKIADEFLDKLVQKAGEVRVGGQFEEGVQMGPLVSQSQVERVKGFLERAKAEGAKVLCGGDRPPHKAGLGYFMAPTILADVRPDMEVWREEVFGPVLSVMRFSSEEEAVALANDSKYGLAAAVFSANEEQLARVARRLKAGVVWQNCSNCHSFLLPWGGVKQSGVGRDWGREGFEACLQKKSVVAYRKEKGLGWMPAPAHAEKP